MTWLFGLIAGAKAKLLLAGAAIVAVLGFLFSVRQSGKSAGRAAERLKTDKAARDAENRKDEVRDPGDRGLDDKLRDGEF